MSTVKRRAEGLLLECTKCHRMLPRGRFQARRARVAGGDLGRKSWCRECEGPYRAVRAARRRERVVGSYGAGDVVQLYRLQGGRCVMCGRDLRVTGYHVDHVVPLARGGLNVKENLQLLCPKDNLRKGSKLQAWGER
jgi:5-methylcytosine-specific restriction endonuclease McrA